MSNSQSFCCESIASSSSLLILHIRPPSFCPKPTASFFFRAQSVRLKRTCCFLTTRRFCVQACTHLLFYTPQHPLAIRMTFCGICKRWNLKNCLLIFIHCPLLILLNNIECVFINSHFA